MEPSFGEAQGSDWNSKPAEGGKESREIGDRVVFRKSLRLQRVVPIHNVAP